MAIEEKQGNEHGAANTFHQLGIIAQEQRNFATAEKWYKKSLEIKEKQGNEHGAATTFNQLGVIAKEQRDFATAEKWYKKSLAIEEKQGNEHGAAKTYLNLGVISMNFEVAEKWYKKALAIFEKLGDEYNSAKIYHNLGGVAQDRQNFQAAEQWYKKSLTISEKQGDAHGTALSYAAFGLLAGSLSKRAESGQWFIKAAQNFSAIGDQHHLDSIVKDYIKNLNAADPETQAILRQNWQQAGLDRIRPLGKVEQKETALDALDLFERYFDNKKHIQECFDTINEIMKTRSEKNQQRTEPDRTTPFEHLEQTRHDGEKTCHHTTLYNWLIGKISCIFKTIKK